MTTQVIELPVGPASLWCLSNRNDQNVIQIAIASCGVAAWERIVIGIRKIEANLLLAKRPGKVPYFFRISAVFPPCKKYSSK